MRRRLFAADSFWNQPLPEQPALATEQDRWLELLRWCAPQTGMHINLHAWTVPVHDVDARTPRITMRRRFALLRDGLLPRDDEPLEGWSFLVHARPSLHDGHPLGHGPGFGPLVPMPAGAAPDGEVDAHLALVDWEEGWAWDMWGVRRLDDGGWCSFTGMRYRIDGDGVFSPDAVAPADGESIHLHGPSRASGLPAIAGLIMRHEIDAGAIEHKLCFACSAPAQLQHCFPARWTDGSIPGGIPEGAVLQLDPDLDLDAFRLKSAARVVARALQRYGAVLGDFAGGVTLYGEGAPADGWAGLLAEDDLAAIPFDRYRLLATPPRVPRGMVCCQHRGLHQAYQRWCSRASSGW